MTVHNGQKRWRGSCSAPGTSRGRGSAPPDTQSTLDDTQPSVRGLQFGGDRSENAGGRVTGTLPGKAFAYQVVATLVKSILFLYANIEIPT